MKIPQRGGIVIEDDVEIGANSAVDRPAVGETRIGAGTKVDNLVQIGHGVKVGRRVLFAAQVGIAGSCAIDDGVVLAGQVGVANHVHLGKGVIATAQTGIPNSVDAGEYISGYPAIPHRDWLKSAAIYRQLPSLRQRVAALEQRIVELGEKRGCRTRRSGNAARGADRWPILGLAVRSAQGAGIHLQPCTAPDDFPSDGGTRHHDKIPGRAVAADLEVEITCRRCPPRIRSPRGTSSSCAIQTGLYTLEASSSSGRAARSPPCSTMCHEIAASREETDRHERGRRRYYGGFPPPAKHST